jgi:hypothetical protein
VPPTVRRLFTTGEIFVGPTSGFVAFPGTSGVRVAEADFTGDGVSDVIAGSGFALPPAVRVFDGISGAIIRDFSLGFPGAGGVFVAAGDVDGDGMPDIITGDNGGSTLVHVFSGASGEPVWGQSFGSAFTGGVRVAAGDVDGDGYADLVVGNGPGAVSLVRVVSGATRAELRAFSPYPGFVGGVFVAAGDVNGDGFADVVTSPDSGGGPHERVFDGVTGRERFGFLAADITFTKGVWVAAGDLTGDGRADVITTSGPGGTVRAFNGMSGAPIALAPAPVGGGYYVSTGVPLNRMVIDAPAAGTTVPAAFRLRGWAFEEGEAGVGIDFIHVWAFPSGGAEPIFLGWATLGDPRPDIGAIFGAQYDNAGYHLDVTGLAEGAYDIAAYAHSSSTGTFIMRRTVRVRVIAPGTELKVAIDVPTGGPFPSDFRLVGWAFDPGSTRADSGIEFLHVYAFPHAGGDPIFLGWGTLGDPRPDVAAVFGPRAAQAGYHLDVTGLAQGAYTVAVYPKAFANPFFSAPATVTITVTTALAGALDGRDR